MWGVWIDVITVDKLCITMTDDMIDVICIHMTLRIYKERQENKGFC